MIFKYPVMNYNKVYNQIIDRAISRSKPEFYTEVHHILPRCIGGSDDPANLVVITAREHFICHWLLSRIYPDNSKLAFAFWSMCSMGNNKQYRYTPSSRVISEAKERAVYLLTQLKIGKARSEETKKKLSIANKGRIRSEEEKKKISEGQKGRIVKQETREKIRKANTGKKTNKAAWNRGIPNSEEARKKMSESLKGRVISEETKKKIHETKLKNGSYKIHSEKMKKRIPWNKGKVGIYSEESLKKMSDSHKKK